MLKELSSVHKSATTYGIGGTVVIAFAGFWLILLTFLNLFYTLASRGLPVGMGHLLDGVRGVAAGLIDHQVDGFLASLQQPLVIVLPLLMWALVVASLIRSARAKSWTPAMTVGFNRVVGMIAFPLFAWSSRTGLPFRGIQGSKRFLMILRR